MKRIDGAGVLRVVAIGHDTVAAGPRRLLADHLSRLLGFAVLETELPASSGADAILALAASARDPLLVHPGVQASAVSAPGSAVVERILVPFDRTSPEHSVLKKWIELAHDSRIEVVQLHVLSESTIPQFWEGPGHHAASWHAEIHRKHVVGPARLSVLSGEAAAAIASEAASADLVLVCWGGDPGTGRAAVLRGLLGTVSVPLLIVQDPPPERSRRRRERSGVVQG